MKTILAAILASTLCASAFAADTHNLGTFGHWSVDLQSADGAMVCHMTTTRDSYAFLVSKRNDTDHYSVSVYDTEEDFQSDNILAGLLDNSGFIFDAQGAGNVVVAQGISDGVLTGLARGSKLVIMARSGPGTASYTVNLRNTGNAIRALQDCVAKTRSTPSRKGAEL